MVKQEQIRIGFIGAGSICRQRHLPNLKDIAHVQVVSVCNRSEASSRSIAQDFDIPHIDNPWQQLIARSDIDAVFIGTWPYMHKQMAIAALEAGKHVFCQARMAMDLAEAQAMVDAAGGHRELVNMICPPPHRMPWEPYIRKLLADGTLGEIRQVRVEAVNGANLGDLHWREQVEYSGKQIMAVGIMAETLNAWLGPCVELTARLATPITSKPGPDAAPYAIGIPQIVDIAGTLGNGAALSEHHCGISRHQSRESITICGSEGTLLIDPMQSIQIALGSASLEPATVPAQLTRPWRVEQDFVDAVRAAQQGQPPQSRPVSPDFAEGLLYMKKLEAIHHSAQLGRAVKLGEL